MSLVLQVSYNAKVMNAFLSVFAVLLTTSPLAQGQVKRIGAVEFFGSAGIDLVKLRSALPFREGDEFSIETGGERLGERGK